MEHEGKPVPGPHICNPCNISLATFFMTNNPLTPNLHAPAQHLLHTPMPGLDGSASYPLHCVEQCNPRWLLVKPVSAGIRLTRARERIRRLGHQWGGL